MSDEMGGLFTIDTDTLNAGGFAVDVINLALHWGVLTPDSTLQDIADAWNELTEIYGVVMPKDVVRCSTPKLAALLEALEGDSDGCGCETGTNHAEFSQALAAGYDPTPGEYSLHMKETTMDDRAFHCPKCGSLNVNLRYSKYGADLLTCVCVRCNHEWNEQPFDAVTQEDNDG